LQLFEGVAQVAIVIVLNRVQPRINHRFGWVKARQRFAGRELRTRDGIAHAALSDILESSGHIPDITRTQMFDGTHVRAKNAHFKRFHLAAVRHDHQCRAGPALAVHHPDIGDHTLVWVIVRVKDEGPQRAIDIALGRADAIDYLSKQPLYPLAILRRDPEYGVFRHTQEFLNLGRNGVRISGGQVDLVDYRNDVQVVIKRQIEVGECLRLDTLRGIDNEKRALTGRESV